jgi:hypothetical protein
MGKSRQQIQMVEALDQMYADLSLFRHEINRMINNGPSRDKRDMSIIHKCLCIAKGELARRDLERIDAGIDAGMAERGEHET